MAHNLPFAIRDLAVQCTRGATIWGMSEMIATKELLVRHFKVIGLLVATNDLDPRSWSDTDDIKDIVDRLIRAYEVLVDNVLRLNPTSFIIFLSVLPRPCDHKRTHQVVKDFNLALKALAFKEHHGYAPLWTSFAKKKPITGALEPRQDLYTSRLLHLNLQGAWLLAHRITQVFQKANLERMMRHAGYRA